MTCMALRLYDADRTFSNKLVELDVSGGEHHGGAIRTQGNLQSLLVFF